ncbi:MAG: ATP-binding cassette domain-containing protein [Synergistetes bacterium]|nr:ATP-binding cassette domain-containing protein [Synergistota bacterium]
MAIKVKEVGFCYGLGSPLEVRALSGVSFELEHGENLGILGPTGSGKSTLVQLLNALLLPTEGDVLVDGLNTKERKNGKRIRKLVGMVFQYPENQFFEDTVYDEVAFGARNLGLSVDEVDRRVRESINLLGLPEDILNKSPFEISGGEKRKVAIASALVRKPKYLIFDEPLAGLDYPGSKALLRLFKSLRKRCSLIIVTHTLDELIGFIDKVLFLENGRVKAFGKIMDLLDIDELKRYIPVVDLLSRLKKRGFVFKGKSIDLSGLEEEIVKNVTFS